MTDMDAFTHSLWSDLREQNILPNDGALMRSCEQELQQLVQNIDILVKKRETDLKQKLKKVYKHFEKKTKECEEHKLTSEASSKKIMTLQAQVDQVTAEKQKVEEIHETQVTKLKSKASRLRTAHERLHKSFLRKIHNLEKHNKSFGGKDEETEQKILELTEKLKECETRLAVVQEQKATRQKEFDSIETECKILLDKNENLEDVNERIAFNLEESERLQQNDEQEVYRLQALVQQQSNDLIDYDKSDNLLKRAVIALRTDLMTKIATITSLEAELEQWREDQANKMQVDHDLFQTLQIENEHLQQELRKHSENAEDYSNLTEQLNALKAEKVALEKRISDQTEKLKNHDTETQSKINEVEVEGAFNERFDTVPTAQAREVDEETTELELQLENGQKKIEEKEEYYQETEDKDEETEDKEEETGDKEEVVVTAAEKVEEEVENKGVDIFHQLNKQVGDIVHQSTLKQSRAVNPANQKNLQHVLGTIDIQPKQSDNVFYVSQSQLKNFLRREQIYRRDWEDNFSEELHHIWKNSEIIIQRYINKLLNQPIIMLVMSIDKLIDSGVNACQVIKLDVSYQLTVDETEQITREERDRRRKIRFQQVREISKTNAAKVRKAVTKTKVKELNKLINSIHEDLNKEKTEKIADLKECYMRSISNIGHGQQLAAQQVNPEVTKCRLMKHYNKNVKLRHNVALLKLQDEKATQYVQENKHIISRKAALEIEKERAMKIASLPVPEQGIFEEVKDILLPSGKNKTVAPHSQISYPPPPVVEKHDKRLMKDGHQVAKAQDLILQEQQQQIKQVSEEQEHIQKDRYQKALQIELLNRDSEKMMKEISFLQKKQTRRRQKNLAKIPKQVFLPPYKRQENLQNKQKVMEKDFEQIYISNDAELKSDLNILLEPHPPIEAPNATDSLDLTLTSEQESIPTPTRQDHSSTMKDITNMPTSQKGTEKSTLQSLFNRIKSQRNEWITDMAENLQGAEAGQDYRRSQIPLSSEDGGSSDFPVDDVSVSEPTHDGIGLIQSTDETGMSLLDQGGAIHTGSKVVDIDDDDDDDDDEIQCDSDRITADIRQPEFPKQVPGTLNLQQQIKQVMEQKKRIEEQKRKLEQRLRNFDKDKQDKLSGYIFNPRTATPLGAGEPINQTHSLNKETFQNGQPPNIKELLEHGRSLIRSSMAHIKDSVELHQNDSSSLNFLPHFSSTNLGKHFPLTLQNLPQNISKVKEYQKQLLQKHEEKLKSPLSNLETKIPSQNAATPTSETHDTGDNPLLLPLPSACLHPPFDQNEKSGGVDVGSNYSSIRPNIPLSSATTHDIQGSTTTSKLEQLLQSFKKLRYLGQPSSVLTGESEKKYEVHQQLGWLNSLPDYLLPSSTSINNIVPENILQKEDIHLPPGTASLDATRSLKLWQQYHQQQQHHQPGLLSPVPEKPGMPSYDVDLLNMLPVKDTESLHFENNFQSNERLLQFYGESPPSLTAPPSSGRTGHAVIGHSSENIWEHGFINDAPSSDSGIIQSNQYSLQTQLYNIDKRTELLCQQLSDSNEQFDRKVETLLKSKEEVECVATVGFPGLEEVAAAPDSASQRKPEEILDQRHPPIQQSAFINGHFPHELSVIEEAESVLMTSYLSDNHHSYSSLTPVTASRSSKKLDTVLDYSNNRDFNEIYNHSNVRNSLQHSSRQDFDTTQNSVVTDHVSIHPSSTDFPDANDSSRTGPLSPKSFTLWQDTNVSISEKAEDALGEKHPSYKTWRDILLERSKSSEDSEDAHDLNDTSSAELSSASTKFPNPEVNFGPLQCVPKFSESSSDEIKLPSVLPSESSTVLPSPHPISDSESSSSEILSVGSLSKELMDNHRDLSTFLSQLHLLAHKNQNISFNSLSAMNIRCDAMQNIVEDGATSFSNKLPCNSVHSTTDATVSASQNATTSEADKSIEDHSEISKFALFHYSDKSFSTAATNGTGITFDSATANITRQNSASNIDSTPVLEASTPSVSVPESSFDLGEIIAPLLSNFKGRVLTNYPFRTSSPISSLTHSTKLSESSSLSANHKPSEMAAHCDDSSLNTFSSLEKIRTDQASSSQVPAYQKSPITYYSLPQTSTSALSFLPLSHTTLYSSSEQINTTGTNEICVSEAPISQYSYNSSSCLDEIDTVSHEALSIHQNMCVPDKPLPAAINVIKEINLQNPEDGQQQQQDQYLSPRSISPTISQYSYSSSSSLDEIDMVSHEVLSIDQNLCVPDKPIPAAIEEINPQNPEHGQQQPLPITISAPSNSIFYSNSSTSNQPECLSPPPPPPTQVVSQKSPDVPQMLLDDVTKDQGLEESSVSDSTSRSQCTVVMGRFSSQMPLGHATSSSASSSSTTAATLEQTNKAGVLKSASLANSEASSEIPHLKTSSDAMVSSNKTKPDDCLSSSSTSSLTQYSYSSSSASSSSSQEDLSVNSNSTVPNPSKRSAMCNAKVFFDPLSNGTDVNSQEKVMWGNGPGTVDADDATWMSLLQESISTDVSNESHVNSKQQLPIDISPIVGSSHSGTTDNSPDLYSSPPLQFHQMILHPTCTKEVPYNNNTHPVTINTPCSSVSPHPMSTSSTTTMTTQQSKGNNSSLSGENSSLASKTATTSTSSSSLSGLSELSLPSNIKQDYQVLLGQARSFIKRFKENEKQQNISNCPTSQNVSSPHESNLSQQCNTPAAMELQEPNVVADTVRKHEISLKRFDSIFDEMLQSSVGILEEPDLCLVPSETESLPFDLKVPSETNFPICDMEVSSERDSPLYDIQNTQ